MTPGDLLPFVRLLEDRIGLDAASVGHDEVGRAVRARLCRGARCREDDLGPSRLRTYWRRLVDDAEEWDEFVEHVLVPETWFFREPAAFDLLERVVGERVAAGRRCRVLSVPCATGEEPYSMAMALHDAGQTSGLVSIDAFDISRRALDAAGRGLYGARAVRHAGARRLARHFLAVAQGYSVNDDIRRLVSFDRVNLVDEPALARRGRYDVIFCRNVLIYFTAAARARVLASLDGILADDGWLVTGHAEGNGVVAPRFVSARVPRTFAYRKGPAADSARTPPRALGAAAGPVAPPSNAGPISSAATKTAVAAVLPAQRGRLPAPGVAEVQRLADAGELAGAVDLCRDHLASNPTSAQGYYLLGVIESALGHRDAAAVALRRAIYLDPGHEPALRQLAGERRLAGDAREADRLLRRADLVLARKR